MEKIVTSVCLLVIARHNFLTRLVCLHLEPFSKSMENTSLSMTQLFIKNLHFSSPHKNSHFLSYVYVFHFRYCECFAAGVYCVGPCTCEGCFNKPVHEDVVLATRKQIEARNPLAFAPKVIRASALSSGIGV